MVIEPRVIYQGNNDITITFFITLGLVGKRHPNGFEAEDVKKRNFGMNGHCLSSIYPLASGV